MSISFSKLLFTSVEIYVIMYYSFINLNLVFQFRQLFAPYGSSEKFRIFLTTLLIMPLLYSKKSIMVKMQMSGGRSDTYANTTTNGAESTTMSAHADEQNEMKIKTK